jgi:DNA-binding CsgD family transcriptional regulator
MASIIHHHPTEPSPTYVEYTNFLKEHAERISYKAHSYYIEKYAFVDSAFNASPCTVYILDYQTKKYQFISTNSEAVLGYTADEFMQKGSVFFQQKMHPDDMAIFSNKIFKKFIRYAGSVSEEEIKQTHFSLNYRFKKKDGSYVQILQHYMVLEVNDLNHPVLMLGFCFDISAYKKDDKMIFSISKIDQQGGLSPIKSYSFPDADLLISNREKEVLICLMDGLGSKQIASRLNISVYTVLAHRRNILKKTNCKNTSELTRYVLANGIV